VQRELEALPSRPRESAKHEAELPSKMISLVRLIRDLDKGIYG
jgi:hypothetical protein